MVEDGPFAADAGVIYQQIKRTDGAKYSPARYAAMMAGFAQVPKGCSVAQKPQTISRAAQSPIWKKALLLATNVSSRYRSSWTMSL
jgi:hypothetical protein